MYALSLFVWDDEKESESRRTQADPPAPIIITTFRGAQSH